MARVTIRYWAAAKDAAGISEETVDADTVAVAVAGAVARHGERLAAVLARCTYLVDDVPVDRRELAAIRLADGAVVEALPPFAGG
jgi:molybdopterin converting factor small subunit